MSENNPTIDRRKAPNERIHLHERGQLPDGTPVGRRGALWYILNESGVAISKGYHEIVPVPEGYEGKLGAVKEQITLPNKGDYQDE